MNPENMNFIADLIEKHANQFDMNTVLGRTGAAPYRLLKYSDLGHTCDTVGCIDGWVRSHLMVSQQHHDPNRGHSAQFLGLSSDEMDQLCYPKEGTPTNGPWAGIEPYHATGQQAAQVLRELVRGERAFVAEGW